MQSLQVVSIVFQHLFPAHKMLLQMQKWLPGKPLMKVLLKSIQVVQQANAHQYIVLYSLINL